MGVRRQIAAPKTHISISAWRAEVVVLTMGPRVKVPRSHAGRQRWQVALALEACLT